MTRRFLSYFPLMLLVAALYCACLDKPNEGSDAGQNNNTTLPDSGVDAEPTPDAAVNCQADDLTLQQTCGSGQKCTLVDTENHLGCAPAGFTSAYSSCVNARTCSSPDRCADDCSLWALCSDADDPGNFVCLPFCEELDAPCLNGKCTHSISLAGGGTAYLCAPADGCDPVTNNGCGANQYCYLDRTGGGLTFCVNTQGTATAGQTCTDDYACTPGLTCFGPVGNGTCYPLCHAGVDAECTGVLCTDIPNTDYGLCI